MIAGDRRRAEMVRLKILDFYRRAKRLNTDEFHYCFLVGKISQNLPRGRSMHRDK